MNDKNRDKKQRDIDQSIENDAQNALKKKADTATIQKEEHEKSENENSSESDMNDPRNWE